VGVSVVVKVQVHRGHKRFSPRSGNWFGVDVSVGVGVKVRVEWRGIGHARLAGKTWSKRWVLVLGYRMGSSWGSGMGSAYLKASMTGKCVCKSLGWRMGRGECLDGVSLGVGVNVRVGVRVHVEVRVGVRVMVGVKVNVRVGVKVRVGACVLVTEGVKVG